MENLGSNKLFLLLYLASVFSCQSKYGALEYSPLQEYEFPSEEQLYSFDLEDFASLLIVNYWEGAVEIQSEQPELVRHANKGPDTHNDLSVDGGWFTAQATHEPTQLKVKIGKNENNSPRHIEMYVDIVNRDASGKVTQKAGSGYHFLLHQMGRDKVE